MRKLSCTLFTLFTFLLSDAQLAGNERQQPLMISTYTASCDSCEKLYIPTSFAKFNCLKYPKLDVLKNSAITAIHLVYTDFPSGNTFETLNRNRLLTLEQMLKDIPLYNIPVTLYRQTSAQNRAAAEKDFHGFVIYYKKNDLVLKEEKTVEIKTAPVADTIETDNDIVFSSADTLPARTFLTDAEFIKKMIANDFNPDSLAAIKEAYLKVQDSTTVTNYYCYSKTQEEFYKANNITDIKIYSKEEMLDKGYLTKESLKFYKGCDKFMSVTTKFLVYNPLARFFTTDSAVTKTLNRNKWANMMVCADVTGSMSPYIIQLLLWLKLNANDRSLNSFVAFNDGDDKPDKKKKIGKTGGIYSTRSWQYKDVAGVVYDGVKNGDGGDIAENDMEALLSGQNLCNDCSNFILIADNNAPVKDISLLYKMNKPVKVILCGVYNFINVDYLNIARKTGGSIHTIEKDITHLALMKEGEIFEFGGRQYKIKGGSFVDITVTKKII